MMKYLKLRRSEVYEDKESIKKKISKRYKCMMKYLKLRISEVYEDKESIKIFLQN
jgi:hypothetical protein